VAPRKNLTVATSIGSGTDSRPATIVARLSRAYRDPKHYNKPDPLAELIFIVLSAATPEHLYRRTYSALRRRFRTWRALANATSEEIAAVISTGGLGQKKAEQIKAILDRLRATDPPFSMEFLRQLPTSQAESFLRSLPGVGIKTARCVLMYSLARPVLPVDTHVWRVSVRLGIVQGEPLSQPSPREQAMLQAIIPEQLRHSLHVNMIAHGRAICRAPRPGAPKPLCVQCCVKDLCPSADLFYP
jgi:endonuclease III